MNWFIKLCIFSTLLYTVCASATSLVPERRDNSQIAELLTLSLDDLMDIEVVSAGKVSERIGDIPASVVLITREQIERYGYASVEEIISHISGYYAVDFYGFSGVSYGVRGFWNPVVNRHIRILVNGISQDYELLSGAHLLDKTAVPVEAIDRIEVVRGPLSVIYGTGAFFGIINIITNAVTQSETHYQVSAMGGSNNTYRTYVDGSYKNAQGHLLIKASQYDTDGIDVPFADLTSASAGSELGFSTGNRLERTEQFLQVSAVYKGFSLDFHHAHTQREGFFSIVSLGNGTSVVGDTYDLRLGYEHTFSKQWWLNTQWVLSHVEQEIAYAVVGDFDQGIEQRKTNTYSGELNLFWQPSDQLQVTQGLFFRHVPTASNYTNFPAAPDDSSLTAAELGLVGNDSIDTWAVFTQLSYTPSPQWRWILGLRLEQLLGYTAFTQQGADAGFRTGSQTFDAQSISVIPRLAAIYRPNANHIFKLMYGTAIAHPSLPHHVSRIFSNRTLPEFESEEIETYELNYLVYLTPRYLLNLNVFRNNLQHLIVRNVASNQVPGQFEAFFANTGEWTTQGLELMLQAEPTTNWKLELGLTYQATEDDHSAIAVPYSPHWLGQVKASYQWHHDLHLSLTGHYVSEMETFYDETLSDAGDVIGRIGEVSDAYWVWGTNVRVENLLTKGSYLNLRISNLFDDTIRYPTVFNNRWADKGTIGAEREIMLTIGYRY